MQTESWAHPGIHRRTFLQAGGIGILGLGMEHVAALQAQAVPSKPRAVIFIFLSGGLSQLESFDLKPDAPAEIRGEFRPIATHAPGVEICEHLPLLAQRSKDFALVRSLTHANSDHMPAHHVRYADDFVILCRTRPQAEQALSRVREIMSLLRLQLHPTKTKLVELGVGKDGFEFLGCHLRVVRSHFKKARYLFR